MSALAAAPGPRLRVLGSRAAYVVAEVDGQEDALRSGRRPDDPGPWGIEPESRWGRLVKGEESEAVPSEPGAWPVFYTEFERALREGGPPPVDPADGVATLEVIDAARRSAAARQTVEVREQYHRAPAVPGPGALCPGPAGSAPSPGKARRPGPAGDVPTDRLGRRRPLGSHPGPVAHGARKTS